MYIDARILKLLEKEPLTKNQIVARLDRKVKRRYAYYTIERALEKLEDHSCIEELSSRQLELARRGKTFEGIYEIGNLTGYYAITEIGLESLEDYKEAVKTERTSFWFSVIAFGLSFLSACISVCVLII